MTSATYAQRAQLADIGGLLLGQHHRSAWLAIMTAPDLAHARLPKWCVNRTPHRCIANNPCVANKTIANPGCAQLQTAKLAPLAMTKSP
jgi:hypothetical protein